MSDLEFTADGRVTLNGRPLVIVASQGAAKAMERAFPGFLSAWARAHPPSDPGAPA